MKVAQNITGMRVDVYKNLNSSCVSIRNMESDSDNYRNVIAHRTVAVVDDPEFIVQQSERERVLRENKKNVHAFVRGNLVDEDVFSSDERAIEVDYNPYTMSQFEKKDGREVHSANIAKVTMDGVVIVE